ncbi:MAG: ABC transporter permease [Polyangiaceae bacterium]|nr:ABC transporter permease [Polyangiaceae bacterium]
MRHSFARALLPLLLVLFVGLVFNANGAFFAWSTHRSMLREISVHGILACGMTVVILAGGIDLAVGSVLGLSAVVFAWLTLPFELSAPLSLIAVVFMGAALGALSGGFVARYRVQPFVVTLAMMVFARGLAKLVSGGEKITVATSLGAEPAAPKALPAIFRALDTKMFGGNVSAVTLVFAACALATWLFLKHLRAGRYVYATGGNREAAELSGVPTSLTLIVAYALSGLFAAIAGICQAAQETHGDPETGTGYELEAIAMVVLGGTALSGGRGGMGLTLLGALTMGYLQKILSLNAFQTEARLMLTGVILLAAVLFQKFANRRAAT